MFDFGAALDVMFWVVGIIAVVVVGGIGVFIYLAKASAIRGE